MDPNVSKDSVITEIMAGLAAVYGGQHGDFREDADVLATLISSGPLTVTPREPSGEFHTVYSIGDITVGIGEGCEDEPARPELLGTTTPRP